MTDAIDDATEAYGEWPMSATKQQQIQTIEDAAPITPMAMLDRAVSAGASVETLEKLMGLQERWERNQARKDFDAAVADAKSEIPPILRNATGHNSKRYADFSGIARVVDPIISKHGLSYRFRSMQDERIHVTCVLSHRAGHSEETTLSGPPDATGNKNAIQAIGSTLTYLQRYSLMQALGLAASNDDDAKATNSDPISDEQDAEIRELIASSGADITKFLLAFQIEAVSDLPASRFSEAKTRLKNFARRK